MIRKVFFFRAAKGNNVLCCKRWEDIAVQGDALKIVKALQAVLDT